MFQRSSLTVLAVLAVGGALVAGCSSSSSSSSSAPASASAATTSAAAISAVEGTSYTFQKVPPGPHGGAMGCANEEGTWTCVWATHTTLCTIQIIDTTGELLGANIGVNAVRIRDAVEAPG